jgi:hypothetical protein
MAPVWLLPDERFTFLAEMAVEEHYWARAGERAGIVTGCRNLVRLSDSQIQNPQGPRFCARCESHQRDLTHNPGTLNADGWYKTPGRYGKGSAKGKGRPPGQRED